MCSPIACHYLSQALQIYNPVLWHCVHLCVCSSFAQFSVHVMYAVFVLLCLNQCLSFTQLSPIFILLLDHKLSVPTVHFCMHQISHFRFKNWERGCWKEYLSFFKYFFLKTIYYYALKWLLYFFVVVFEK